MKLKRKIDPQITKALNRFEEAVCKQAQANILHDDDEAEKERKAVRKARRELLALLTPTIDMTPRAVQNML